MNINLIKQLREQTGMGILEVKHALNEAGGDIEKAKILLMKPTTKSDSHRIASKGSTKVKILGDEAILFEVNGETDFVSKNPDFIQLLNDLAELFITSKAITIKDALHLSINHMYVKEYIDYVSHVVKENIYLRRFHRIKKQPTQGFSYYEHQGGKISVLVIMNKIDDTLGRDIALHITSQMPKYLKYDQVDINTFEYERMLIEKEGKIIDESELINTIKNECLYEQPFIKNSNITISELIKTNEVIDFYRFELGQGIENKLNCRLDIPCDGSKITVTPIY